MPSVSKQQQKFMGLVHAVQKGDVPKSAISKKAQQVAKDMNPKDVKDFASTKHKGLPKKIKQEILKKLKEYAFIADKHTMPNGKFEPLRKDYEMDLQNEDRIPQNFNVGTNSDYHRNIGAKKREYDDTNFEKDNSGQPDLEEVQAVSGGKVHKLITGKNLKFRNKSYKQIDFETLGVDNKNGTIRLKIIAPKEIFGNEMSLDFRTVRRGPFFKTDTNNQLSEVGLGDWHYKAIKKMYQKAGAFTRKKIAAVITKNPNASWNEIEKEIKFSDYDEITNYTDKLGLKEVIEKLQNFKK